MGTHSDSINSFFKVLAFVLSQGCKHLHYVVQEPRFEQEAIEITSVQISTDEVRIYVGRSFPAWRRDLGDHLFLWSIVSEVVALASFCFSLLCGWLLLPLHLKRKVLQKACPPRQRTNIGPRCNSNSEQHVAQQIFCRGESNILRDAKQAGVADEHKESTGWAKVVLQTKIWWRLCEQWCNPFERRDLMIVFLSQEKWKEMLSSLKGTRQLLKEGIAGNVWCYKSICRWFMWKVCYKSMTNEKCICKGCNSTTKLSAVIIPYACT